MKSVVGQMRRELEAMVKAMSVDERFELIDRLAEQDLAAFCAKSRLPRRAALRALARRRQAGRRPSKVALAILDNSSRE